MLKTLGIVQASFKSPRLRYNAARKLGGKSVLEWVVRRVTDCQQLDGVIALTSDVAENQFVAGLIPLDVPVFAAPPGDSLSQFLAAFEEYPASGVVRVRADYPFVDPMLIDRLVVTAEAHQACDYVCYCSRDGRPAILSPVGVYAEWFRSEALRRAAKSATAPADRQHVTRYFYSHPEKFNLRLIPAPPQIDREDVRLTVDIEEDWDHALAIFDALGPDELDWQRIARLLEHQPALRRRMASLNRAYARA